MRLKRDNTDDPRVEHDLDLLAAAYGGDERDAGAVAVLAPEVIAEPDEGVAGEGAGGEDDSSAGGEVARDIVIVDPAHGVFAGGPFQDAFVRRFVASIVHVRRYLPYYLATLAWVIVMLAFAPAASHRVHDLAAAPASSSPSRSSASGGRAVPPSSAPATTAGTAATPAYTAPPIATGDAGIYADLGSTLVAGDTGSSSSSSSKPSTSSSSATDTPSPAAGGSSTAVATGLTIVRSGYASSTAGTPAEQDPGDGGLPVAAAGGQAMKRSFVALGGSGTVLHLAVSSAAGANVGDAQAHIAACPILKGGWEATRGQAMPGPDFYQPCALGQRQADGSWIFDLSAYGDPTSQPGFVLTADPADSAASFQVVFAPKTVAASAT